MKKNNISSLSLTPAANSPTGLYKFNVEFYIFEEEGLHIAYCPSLDLSTSGASFNDAVSAFYECLQLYIETCLESGTLLEDLTAHGWKVAPHTLSAPRFDKQLKQPQMKRLVNAGIGFEKIVAPARISMA